MAFKGHWLHGVPSELIDADGAPRKTAVPSEKERVEHDEEAYLRCTFLVNIWINTGPPNGIFQNPNHSPILIKSGNGKGLGDGLSSKNTFLKAKAKRGVVSEITTGGDTPVCGFEFGKSARNCYQLWMPLPMPPIYKGWNKKTQQRDSFELRFEGGDDAPCFLCLS